MFPLFRTVPRLQNTRGVNRAKKEAFPFEGFQLIGLSFMCVALLFVGGPLDSSNFDMTRWAGAGRLPEQQA